MRIQLRSEREIFLVVAALCLGFSFAQSAETTTSDFHGSSKKVSTLTLRNSSIATTTVATTIKTAYARITGIEPEYGPDSGGTKVSISGQDMTCPPHFRIIVQLNSGTTRLTAHNCTKETDAVSCFTPSKGTPGNTEFKVEVSCDGINTNFSLWRTNDSVIFTYRPDPIITEVYPKESIMAGGITQTVIGTNLDSAAHPQMWTGFDPPSTGQGQLCIVLNSTLLMCRTQSIDFGSSANDTVRTNPNEISFDKGNVSIGFVFDGFTGFQRFATLRMFHNPEIDKFKPETKNHLTNANKVLSIGVTWPHMNFTPSDLTVHVGIRTCGGVELAKSSINCHPPPLPKSIIRYGPLELNTLEVSVSVGHMTRQVIGHLHYTSTEPFHVVMIVMIAILAFIFVVSLCCGLCVFCDLQVSGCKEDRPKRSKFRPMSDASESAVDGSSDGGGRNAGKRRKRWSGTKAAEDVGPIECVAMEYRGDGKNPQ